VQRHMQPLACDPRRFFEPLSTAYGSEDKESDDGCPKYKNQFDVTHSAPGTDDFHFEIDGQSKTISRRTAKARMYQEPSEKTTTRKTVRKFSQTQFNYTQALLRLRRGNWIAWILQTELSERFWIGHTKTWRTTRLRTKLVSVRRSKRLGEGPRDRQVFAARPRNASLRPKQPY
jgi:hypothetical protein